MKNKVTIPLGMSKEELSRIFSYSEKMYNVKDSQGKESQLTTLASYMAHYFDQTLKRDQHDGAWAQVLLDDDGAYYLKMYCERADLSPYEESVPAMLTVAQKGVDIFQEAVVGDMVECPVEFLLPFGLTMTKTKSVQLLHYPPLESLVYLDYLYSPTNRRWEDLLGFNTEHVVDYSPFETIVDIVPLAAPGDDGKDLSKYTSTFTVYIKEMLKFVLKPIGSRTQPLVAYGGSVRTWLKGSDAFGDQIPEDLQVLTLLNLDILGNGSITPVLCANHPSQYLYLTDEETSQTKIDVMTQDLIVAGWQAIMGESPHKDPQTVLNDVSQYWYANPCRITEIMKIQDDQYGYDGMQTELDYNKTKEAEVPLIR